MHGIKDGKGLAVADALSFTAISQRIDALPAGPVSALDTPRWQWWLDALGMLVIAAFFVLFSFIKLEWIMPAIWMISFAKISVWSACLLFLPGMVRMVFIMIHDMRQGTAGFMRQWDHDTARLNERVVWLRCHPRPALEHRLRHCRMLQEIMQRRLGLFTGSSEKLGVIPALLALFYLLPDPRNCWPCRPGS